MNWDAIGAIGELVGALAVFISLVYLALQIRNQNNEARAAAVHEFSLGFRESVAQFGVPETAEVFTRCNNGDESLTEVERLMLMSCMQRNLRVWEEAYGQYRRGRLEEEVWIAMDKQYRALMGSRSGQWAWGLRKEFFADSFREYVESSETIEYKLSQ